MVSTQPSSHGKISGGNQGSINVYERVSVSKELLLGAFLWGVSFWLGYVLRSVLGVSDDIDFARWLPFLISVVVFLVMVDLVVMLVSEKTMLVISCIGSSIFVVAGFLDHISVQIIIAGVALAIFMLLAGYEGRRMMDGALKIRFFAISKVILSRAIVGIALMLAIIFFGIFSQAPLGPNNPILPQHVFETSMQRFSHTLAPILGGIDFSKTLRAITQNTVESAIQSQGLPLTKYQQNVLINKYLTDYQNKISKFFGRTIDPDKTLSSAFYDLLLSKFNGLNDSSRRIVLAGMAFLLFLSVQAVAPIMRWIAGGIAYIIFLFLKAMNFFAVVTETKNKEVILLS